MRRTNSPLRYAHQKVLLGALHETRNAEPACLLVFSLAIARADHISHQRAVATNCHFLRRNTQTSDDGHARNLGSRGGAEAARERGADSAAERGGVEHFDDLCKESVVRMAVD